MLSPSDSLSAQTDSSLKFSSLTQLGSLTNDSSYIGITAEELRWKDYRSLGDVLATLPGFFYNDLGSVGQPSQLTYKGMDASSIGVFIDGRPMNEPLTGIADLNFIPTEMIERIEIIPAPRALLYGMNSNAVAINIITKSFDSKIPYSRIKYTEGAYEEGFFDGILAHNLSQNMNLSVGIQRRSIDGRYENSADGEWSVRSKLRWNVSEKFNIALLQLYNKQKVGLFGGLRADSSVDIYDPNFALIENLLGKKTHSRWDWQLTGFGTFFSDSLNKTFLTLYSMSLEKIYRSVFPYTFDAVTDFTDNNSIRGIIFSQTVNIAPVSVEFGGNISKERMQFTDESYFLYSNNSNNSYSSFWGKTEIPILRQNMFSLYYKLEKYKSSVSDFFSYTRNNLGGDFSWGKRNNLNGTIGFVTNDVKNNRLFLNISTEVVKKLSVEIQSIFGRNDKIDFLFIINYVPGKFRFKTSFDFGINEYGESTTIPDYSNDEIGYYASEHYESQWINIDALYEDYIFEDHLKIQTGLRGKFIHRNDDVIRYNAINDNFERERLKGFTGSLDFLFFAKLGDAVVHFTIENLLNTKYYVVPFYPMPDRNLRLGVTWEFLN
jgi:outer membrane receptor protein involved in Fe transport